MKTDFNNLYCLVKTDDATYCGSVHFYQEKESYGYPTKVLLFSAMRIDSKSRIDIKKLNKRIGADIRVKYIDEVYIPDVKEIIITGDQVLNKLYERAAW